jgi:hypothetical protein
MFCAGKGVGKRRRRIMAGEGLIKLAAAGNQAALLMIQGNPEALEAAADLLMAGVGSDPEQTRFERHQMRGGLLLDEVEDGDGEKIVVEGDVIGAIKAGRRLFCDDICAMAPGFASEMLAEAV